MNDYYMRIEAAGLLDDFKRARAAKDQATMKTILARAGFNALEIDSVVWSGGDIPEPMTEEDRRWSRMDEILGRICLAVVTGVVVGVLFVFVSLKLDRAETSSQRSERLAEDYRTPAEAIYRPFRWGFGIGAALGLVTAEGFLIGLMSAAWKEDRSPG